MVRQSFDKVRIEIEGTKNPIPKGMGFVFYSDSTRIQASGLPVF